MGLFILPQACLKTTGVALDLVSDPDMHLFLER